MKQPKKLGFLSLANEISKNEQKNILGGTTGNTCGNGMGCTTSTLTLAYCQAVWHSNTISSCSIGSSYTVCTGGTYAIGCQPAYCAGAGHGTYLSCQ